MQRKIAGIILFAMAMAASRQALSHPHVLVEASTEVIFNDKAEVSAVRHHWRFDEAFSSFAKQGLDKNGKFTRESLQPLAEINVKSLEEFGYFTRIRSGPKRLTFGKPQDYWIDHDDKDGTLVLSFTLSLAAPVKPAEAPLRIEIGDPSYFVAFEMAKTAPARLDHAPAACKVDVRAPEGLDAAAATQLSRIPSTVRELPPELSGLTQSLYNTVAVTCP